MQINVPIADDLMLASGRSAVELERELQLLLAIKLFELHRVSVGMASKMAGISRFQFMDELARLEIPLINLDGDQIADELTDG